MSICDICKKNQATHQITRIHNGIRETTNICVECSGRSKKDANPSGAGNFGDLNDLFGGLFGSLFVTWELVTRRSFVSLRGVTFVCGGFCGLEPFPR